MPIPDPSEFFEKFNIDPEKLNELLEANAETIQELLGAVMTPEVAMALDRAQRTYAKYRALADSLKDQGKELESQVPAIQSDLAETVESLSSAAASIDLSGISARIKGELPKLGLKAAQRALNGPQGADYRAQIQSLLNKAFASGYADEPGAATAAIAVRVLNARMSLDTTSKSNAYAQMALETAVPEPYLVVTETVIKALAAERGVSYADELGRWTQDVASKTVFTQAVKRYAAAKNLDALSGAEYLQATSQLANGLELLFAGVARDWLASGDSPAMKSRALRSANKTLGAFDDLATAATAKPEAPKAPARRPARKSTTPKATTPKRTPRKGADKGKEGLG